MQWGYTALMMASMNGHVNVVQCLVQVGANLEAANVVSGHVVWEHVDV
jgi:ankyrin repeat protein